MSIMPSNISQLAHLVVRIRAINASNPNIVNCGTGFFFAEIFDNGTIIIIITNKHVVDGCGWIEFDFALADKNNNRIFGSPKVVKVRKNQISLFPHPDRDVDLVGINVTPLLNELLERGINVDVRSVSSKIFLPPYLEAWLPASASVLMVGFPDGIMDEVNNLPVIRRGTLALQFDVNYRGKSDFVVDIAAFGGSSGSPVFAFFENSMPTEDGKITLLTQPWVFFIGVLHSGPVITETGKIVTMPVPTNPLAADIASALAAKTTLSIHLGYCAKYTKVKELVSRIVGV